MKKMTKLMLTLALLIAGVGGANAEEGTKTPLLLLKNGVINTTDFDITPITPSTLTTDNLYAATFVAKNQTSNVFKYENLDVSEYDKAVVKFGEPIADADAWQINLPTGSFTALPKDATEYEVSLDGVDTYGDFTIFSWFQTGKSITISEVYLFKSADPLASLKTALSEKIARARMYNSLAYTDASFDDLTGAISAAETALNAADATSESLTSATTNVQDAIDGLEFKDGYENLTAAMFKAWNKADGADAISTGAATSDYNLFVSTGQPYGEGGVGYLHYADLTPYEKLIIVATEGTPRVMMNRTVDGGSYNETESESKMIEMPKNGQWTDRYYTKEGVVYTYDLALMTSEKGFAHLNAIKGANWANVTVTGMYLYKAPDPLADFKDALSEKIALARLYSSVGKTTASFEALTQAISDGVTALADNEATEQSLTDAKMAIVDAIDGLTLAENYALLTKEMFKQYASVEEPGAGTTQESCAYDLFKASDLPYGDGNVSELKWADLAAYDKLVIVTNGTIKPRLCINRLEAGGNQAATQEDSKMLDINPNNGYTWSTEKYQTIEGNVYTINIKKIVADYGFARLHCIKKQGWGDGVFITDLLLYTEPDPLASFKALLSDKIAEGQAVNTYAKSAASVEALNQAISDGQDALVDDNATEQSLTDAVQAINSAIAGLTLADGYTNLTAAMYKTWDSATEPSTSEDAGCAYVLGTSTGLPYGDSSVKWYHFADISDFSTMYLLTTDGTPRVMMNREEGEPDGGDYVEIKNAPVDGKVTIDLTAYDYAHMNAIKGANWQNVTITEMLLYRTVTVGATGYSTFGSLSKNAKLNGTKAYAAVFNGNYLQLTEVTEVPAGKGVVIEAEAGTYAPTFDVEASDIESDLKVSNGTVEGDGSSIFVLAKKNDKVGFYLLGSGVKVPAGKCYLEVPAASREFIGFDSETTGISEVKNAKAASAVYDLQGRRVAQPAKGLYIKNSKKMLVK